MKKKRVANPYYALMQEVCVGLGFCGSVVGGEPRHVDDFVLRKGLVNADQFVDWIFKAEGTDGTLYNQHRKALKAAFLRHMGSDTVDAKMLRWDI
jgi:hypothetical protein